MDLPQSFENKHKSLATKNVINGLTKLVHTMKVRDENYYVNHEKCTGCLPYNMRLFSRECNLSRLNKILHAPAMLIINLKTVGDVLIDEVAVRFEPGNALLLLPHQLHRYEVVEDADVMWLFIGFERENMEDFYMLRNRPMSITPDMGAALTMILERYTCDRAIEHLPSFALQIATLLEFILQVCLQEFNCSMPGSQGATDAPIRNASNFLLYRTSKYIHDNWDTKLSVSDVAKKFSVSAGHLRNVYHKHLGHGVRTYIQYVKLHFACVLMETTDFTLSEIALQCGYESIYTFSRAFKQHKGISPSEYRKQKASENE